MGKRVTLVLLATAWGPKYGGINAFNVELARSLGIMPGRDFGLACIVPQAGEADEVDASRHSVRLINLSLGTPNLIEQHAGQILAALAPASEECVIWIGHDDKTGPLALALRQARPGSRAVLIHHMAFGAYQDHKKGNSAEATAKREQQRGLFRQADLCLAVGPMLRQQLEDLLQTCPRKPAVEMIVPGLAEPDPEEIAVRDSAPSNFVAFLAGRLGSEDERIKQAMLGVKAFGAAVGQAMAPGAEPSHPMRRSPTLCMRGVPDDQHGSVRQAVQAAGGHSVNCDLSGYTENRAAYFQALAGSSVAMMPSWHEGFGLTAWEAIACQVPVVIGEQSGVYRLLHDHCQGMGLGRSVRAVPVQGLAAAHTEEAHSEQDLANVRDALLDLGRHIDQSKTDAVNLHTLLRRQLDFTWRRCASDAVEAIEHRLGLALRQQLTRAAAPPTDPAPLPELPLLSRGAQHIPAFLQLPRPQPVDASLGLAPSALLRARDQIVAFHAERQPVIDGWLAAMSAPGRPLITLQLVTGPGGMGKTRSALELAARAQEAGWAPLWMADNLPADAVPEWRRWLATHDQPTLLVVDYAEARQPTLLQWLDAALATFTQGGAAPGSRLHLLCLARQGEWWSELARRDECTTDVANLLTGQANLGSTALPAWGEQTGSRESAYAAALKAYAQALGQPEPPGNSWQPDWSSAAFARPLYLHLAALAALAGERPGHARQLLQAQLDREWRFWRQQALAPETSHDDWADILAWLALAQGASFDDARAVAQALGMSTGLLMPGLQRLYGDGEAGLSPLQPDLLAEALVVERLGSARGPRILAQALPADDARQAARTLTVLARLSERRDARLPNGESPRWAQAVVAALAQAWPAHGAVLVTAGHRLPPSFATWLEASWSALPANAQDELAPQLGLPRYSTPLLRLAVEVARAALRSCIDETSRANALNTLGVRLSDLGGAAARAEALVCAHEAVAAYRGLSQTQPATYLPELAGSLNNLANRLSEQGDAASRAEALDRAREAVTVYRDLAQPAAALPDLAMSLNNLSNHLSEQGDAASRTEALACAREAVVAYRDLAQASPAVYLPDLAASLNNLANRLSELGDSVTSLAEALACAREAVATYRHLAKAQPSAYLPDLAGALNNLANRLSESGDSTARSEVLDSAREAVVVFRELARAQPAANQSNLAMSLNNLASHLSEQGDAASHIEALAYAHEAVAIYRDLAQAQPTAYLPDLARSLNTLAVSLSEQGDAVSRAEALAYAREAVLIYRQAYEKFPSAYVQQFQIATRVLMHVAESLGLDAEAERQAALAPLMEQQNSPEAGQWPSLWG